MKTMQAMTRNVVCILASDSLETAQDIMNEWEIRHLPVTESGKLVGVISDRDLLLRTTITAKGEREIEPLEVRDVMAINLVTCMPGDTIARAATLLTDRKIDCLPVVEADGELVGLITTTDLLELLKERDFMDSTRLIPWRYELKYGVGGLSDNLA